MDGKENEKKEEQEKPESITSFEELEVAQLKREGFNDET